MKNECEHRAHAWVPGPRASWRIGPASRRPTACALAFIALAASLMLWGAVLFYGPSAPCAVHGGVVGGGESFAVFAAVPGQLLASLLMWLAARSYVQARPQAWLVVALLLVGHAAGTAMSALFATGMLRFVPLLWMTPTPGTALILLGPAVVLGTYFRQARYLRLSSLLAAGLLSVAAGMFAWSVLGHFGGVGPATF